MGNGGVYRVYNSSSNKTHISLFVIHPNMSVCMCGVYIYIYIYMYVVYVCMYVYMCVLVCM